MPKVSSVYPIEFIRWVDSSGIASHWTAPDDLPFGGSLECQTAGFLVDERGDRISIAESAAISPNGEGVSQLDYVLTIPKCAITERRRLAN